MKTRCVVIGVVLAAWAYWHWCVYLVLRRLRNEWMEY